MLNDKEADAFYAWYLDHTQHGWELKDTAIEAWNQSRDRLLSLLDTQETKEAVARALHRWNVGHLPEDEQAAYWARDKHQCRSRATAALSTIKRILTGKE